MGNNHSTKLRIAVEYSFPLLNVLNRRRYRIYERCMLVGSGTPPVDLMMDCGDEFRISGEEAILKGR